MTKSQKQELRRYLRYYPDGRLAELLAHAEDGKLSYGSCCCFVGCLTADHPLRHRDSGPMTGSVQHIYRARELDGGSRDKLGPAERAFMEIASADADRRRLVTPLIRAEQKRRSAARIQPTAVSPERLASHGAQASGRALGSIRPERAFGVGGQLREEPLLDFADRRSPTPNAGRLAISADLPNLGGRRRIRRSGLNAESRLMEARR